MAAEDSEKEPWYKDGLRFTCSGCGDCCTGGAGYVWVNNEEIAKMAALVRLSVEDFEAENVRKVGVRKSLIEYENGDCVFFDNKSRKCAIYSERPRQCRTWPFWDSNIRTPEAWADTCQVCPGSGQGRLYQLEEIQQQAAVIRL
jgi:Fe-S-cluster containining protein